MSSILLVIFAFDFFSVCPFAVLDSQKVIPPTHTTFFRIFNKGLKPSEYFFHRAVSFIHSQTSSGVHPNNKPPSLTKTMHQNIRNSSLRLIRGNLFLIIGLQGCRTK